MSQKLNAAEKVLAAQDIASAVAQLPRPLVFTNGCFDILHRGHTTYLEQARNLGAAIVVGVNADESVRRQGKGEDRPLNVLEDRMAVLAALQCVDAVVSFSEDTPLNLILAVQPDILVKGGDWAVEDIVGGKEVKASGGKVYSIAFQHDRSTSGLIEKIRNSA